MSVWNALRVGVASTPDPCTPVAIGNGVVSSKCTTASLLLSISGEPL